jgi:hypothetical protein
LLLPFCIPLERLEPALLFGVAYRGPVFPDEPHQFDRTGISLSSEEMPSSLLRFDFTEAIVAEVIVRRPR